MNKKMKIVWLTQFSNSEIREHLSLGLSVIKQLYYSIRGFHATPHVDRFSWNTNMIIQAEKLTDYFDLFVVCPYRNIRKRKICFKLRGINYIFIKDQSSDSFLNSIKKRVLHNSFPTYPKNWAKLESEIDKIHPDIIHLIGAENVNYSPAIIDLSKKYKTIAQLQTLMIDPEFPTKYPISKEYYEYRSFWEAKVLQSVHYVGTNSPTFVNIIKEKIDANKNFLNIELPEGEMADRNANSLKEYDFEYHAFDIEKASWDAVESFAIACKKHPNIKLDIIGGCSEDFKKRLIQRIAELGVGKNVVFEGRFETIDQVKQQVKKSKFSVIPLQIDYISSTIIESMAFGNPVVSTITPGTPTLNIKRKSLLLSPIGDYQAMADNMCSLVENDSFASQIKENAFQTIEEMYDHYSIIKKWIDTYKEITELKL